MALEEGASVLYSSLLALSVSVCMLVCSWVVFDGLIVTDGGDTKNLQCLCAGMVLAATSELYQSIDGDFCDASLGMASGIGLIYFIRYLDLSATAATADPSLQSLRSSAGFTTAEVGSYQSLQMVDHVEVKDYESVGQEVKEMQDELLKLNVEAASCISVSTHSSIQSEDTTAAFIPLSLIFPICVDSVIDGVLIGATSSISMRTGTVLTFVQTIEMSVLGMVLGSRVRKIEESSKRRKCLSRVVIFIPPLLLFLAALISSVTAHEAQASAGRGSASSAFIAGFAVVQLTYLACFELLQEASKGRGLRAGEGHGGHGVLLVFLGVWVMCALNNLVG